MLNGPEGLIRKMVEENRKLIAERDRLTAELAEAKKEIVGLRSSHKKDFEAWDLLAKELEQTKIVADTCADWRRAGVQLQNKIHDLEQKAQKDTARFVNTYERIQKDRDLAHEELSKVREQITELIDIFLDYAEHALACPARWKKKCDCGLAELVEKYKPAQRPKVE